MLDYYPGHLDHGQDYQDNNTARFYMVLTFGGHVSVVRSSELGFPLPLHLLRDFVLDISVMCSLLIAYLSFSGSNKHRKKRVMLLNSSLRIAHYCLCFHLLR